MKYKKYILFFSVLTLTSILLAVPVRGQIIEGFIDPDTYVRIHGHIGRNDGHIWGFASSDAEILVVALDNEQYIAFINLISSEYTALLCDGELVDYGMWRPPYSDYWHILYINIGSVQTYIIVEHTTEWRYYSKDIGPVSLITGFAGFFVVAGIGGVMLGIQKRKKKRQVDL